MSNSGKSHSLLQLLNLLIIAGLAYAIFEIRNTNEKLKVELEFLKSEQSKIREGVADVQDKLKFDLEFIKANQATLQENHNILEKIMEKK